MFDKALEVGCLTRHWRWGVCLFEGAGGGVFDEALEVGCLTRRWRWGV